MYPRTFLCEEVKIKQRTPLKKEICEIGEEAIWEYRFTSFFFFNEKKLNFLRLMHIALFSKLTKFCWKKSYFILFFLESYFFDE